MAKLSYYLLVNGIVEMVLRKLTSIVELILRKLTGLGQNTGLDLLHNLQLVLSHPGETILRILIVTKVTQKTIGENDSAYDDLTIINFEADRIQGQ
jgi:hypothetical protein